MLTAERLRELVHYDPETGVMTRALAGGRVKETGSINSNGYLQVFVGGRRYKLHRLAWLYMTGQWPSGDVDHKNGSRTDNRWSNLRDVSEAVNSENKRKARSDSKTGLMGVSARGDGRYRARIMVAGRSQSIGDFRSADEAHQAYVEAKRRLHVGCTI